MKKLGVHDGVDRTQLFIDEFDQVAIRFADDLDQDVERPCGDHEIVDLVVAVQSIGDLGDIAPNLDAHHGLSGEAQAQGIGHGDDFHHAGIDEPGDPLTDGSLGQPHGLAEMAESDLRPSCCNSTMIAFDFSSRLPGR